LPVDSVMSCPNINSHGTDSPCFDSVSFFRNISTHIELILNSKRD
jgi:hypothetical protein